MACKDRGVWGFFWQQYILLVIVIFILRKEISIVLKPDQATHSMAV